MACSRTFWERRQVLVTGATGLLGGALVKDLLAEGANVTALVRDGASDSVMAREGLLSRVNTVNGQLEDLRVVTRMMSEYDIKTVFHLAAQPLVGVAKKDPIGTLQANVQGTWNVLEAARQTKAEQLIVASSDKAYGASEKLPYREVDPLQGRFPYDVSKSCADLICTMYAATYGLPVLVTRCGNLFGGGDLNFSRTVPGVIAAAHRRERFVIRSDGKFIRDFLYIKDASKAYMLAAEQLAARPELGGEAFNFSLELRLTVLDIVEKVLSLMGSTIEPIILNQASGEIREQYMACDKARDVLGWAPVYGLDLGLRETIDWYLDWFQSKRQAPARLVAAR